MAVQYSTTLRNNQLDQLESTVGTSAKLHLYSGAAPDDCTAVASGTKLVEMALPSDWMAAASNGSKVKTGTWSGIGTASAGTGTAAGYFRIYDSANITCHMQGTVTVTGGGGDMTLDNVSIAANQVVTVNTFSVTAGNA